MFKVQNDVPIPSPVRDLSNLKRLYPFHTMQVGQFFFVPNRTKNTLSSHASTIGVRLQCKFVTRLTFAKVNAKSDWTLCAEGDKDAVLGIGCWREA